MAVVAEKERWEGVLFTEKDRLSVSVGRVIGPRGPSSARRIAAIAAAEACGEGADTGEEGDEEEE